MEPRIIYVVNIVTKVMHKAYADAAGKPHSQEPCNIDDIEPERQAIFDAPPKTYTSKLGRISPVKLCKRCFPEGDIPRPQFD